MTTDTIGREMVELDPFVPTTSFHRSYFWVAYAVLFVIAGVLGFLAPQIVSAGTVTQTKTVTKTVDTTLPPVQATGVEVAPGVLCDILSTAKDPELGKVDTYIHCPAAAGDAP